MGENYTMWPRCLSVNPSALVIRITFPLQCSARQSTLRRCTGPRGCSIAPTVPIGLLPKARRSPRRHPSVHGTHSHELLPQLTPRTLSQASHVRLLASSRPTSQLRLRLCSAQTRSLPPASRIELPTIKRGAREPN